MSTPVFAGLCRGCAHARRVESARGSVFLRCQAEGRPKYPALPVLRCADFERVEQATESIEPAESSRREAR